MWVADGITGRPAAASRRFRVAARSWWRARSSGWALTWRMLASAAGGDRGRHRGREDEARAAGAHEVDGRGGRGDVAADHAERLGERALHDVDLVEHAVALGHAARRARRTCRRHGPRRDRRARRSDGRGRTARRSARCRRPSSRPIRRRRAWASPDRTPASSSSRWARSLCRKIVRTGARVADAGDHRGVVVGVGIELAARQQRAQGLQGGLVGDVARGEDQRRFLAVQRGELALERDVQGVGAGDVARAAGARALGADRGLHRLEHHRMLAHGEVVVAAPHRDVAQRVPSRWKRARGKAPTMRSSSAKTR